MNEWTIERVKEELPCVQVILGDGTVVEGQVAGRKLRFAQVRVTLYGSTFSEQYSWGAVASALNRGTCLYM